MWKSLQNRLREVEYSLLNKGDYVDKFDALSLAGIDITSENNTKTQLGGLTRLVANLTTILNEAHIHQQSAALLLSSESQNCDAAIRKYHSLTSSNFSTVEEQNSPNSKIWEQLPIADDDTSPSKSLQQLHNVLSENKRRAAILSKQIQRNLQDIHDSAMQILDAKLAAFSTIDRCLTGYATGICWMADESGLSYSQQRTSLIMQPQIAEVFGARFLDTQEISEVLRGVRQQYADMYYQGRFTLAERHLLRTSSRFTGHWLTFVRMGAGGTLVLWAFSECFNNEQYGSHTWQDPTFAIFMCFGDLLLLLWMWGVSVFVWRSCGIDYIRLLNLEHTELDGVDKAERIVFSSATDVSLIFLAVFILFNKVMRDVFHIRSRLVLAHALPVCLVAFFIYRIVCPPVPRRRWLGMLGQVLAAPLFPVIFRDGYIGDLLTSLVRVMVPLCFSLAYLVMSAIAWLSNDVAAAASTSDLWWQDSYWFRFLLVPFVTLAPLWIRLVQCLRRSVESGKRWPHFANALKYTSAIAVISFGTFRPYLRENRLWIAAFVGATLFQFTWDVTMDWGIVVTASSRGASSVKCMGLALRQTKLLGPTWLYVLVMVGNLGLRFAWTLTLLPANPDAHNKTFYSIVLFHLGPLVAAAEVLRRMVWGFFRLEHEQLEVLGAPEMRLSAFADLPHTTFEKMDVHSPLVESREPKKSGGSSIITQQAAVSSVDLAAVMILPDYVVTLASYVGLDVGSNPQAKARLLESILFAVSVLGIIFMAAIPVIEGKIERR